MSDAPVPAPAHVASVFRLLSEHTDPIQLRIRERRLRVLAERLAVLEPAPDAFAEEARDLKLATLLVHARRSVEDAESLAFEADGEFEKTRIAFFATQDPQRRADVLARWLDAAPGRRRPGDARALRKSLDIDALGERVLRDVHLHQVQVELALIFCARVLEHYGHDPSAVPDEVRSRIASVRFDVFVAERLEVQRRWQTRHAALRALSAWWRHFPEKESSAPRRLGDVVRAIADDPTEHPWVRLLAFEAHHALQPDTWREHLPRRLQAHRAAAQERDDDKARPADDAEGFVARRQWALWLAAPERDPDDRLWLLADDPSEYVRIGLCEAAAARLRLAPTDNNAKAWLARAARSDLVSSVRGSAIVATAAFFADARPPAATDEQRPDGGSEPPPAAAELHDWAEGVLVDVLASEQEDDLVALACRNVEARLFAAPDLAPPEAIAAALRQLASDSARSALIHEVSAALLERMWFHADKDRSAALGRLSTTLRDCPRARSTRLADHGFEDPDAFGRALAVATRRDWGVSAEPKGKRVRLHRGDVFRTRLWRILHELRTPAPNKRQAFRHTIGRARPGTLRAHPGRLDEITHTIVPGERVHCDTEGGWGRHFPLPDDVIDARPGAPIQLYSSHGRTTVTNEARGVARLRQWWRLRWRYPRLSAARFRSLSAKEPASRGEYARSLREEGIVLSFTRYPDAVDAPDSLRDLFPESLGLAPLVPLVPQVEDWMRLHGPYFLTLEGNSQTALGLFLGGISLAFLGDGYRRRRSMAAARDAIPLCVGGWGSRGKSGTERCKAGFFHGLGFQVFSKTTGCEAMFIHSVPEGPPAEIFVFRPYGKATIWEQRDLVRQAKRLDADVFLWECMGLNPHYVEILQHTWMQDDLATITNAYPDHEDIQGPAGMDVATVVSRFIPKKRTVVSSEINFATLMRDVSADNGTEYIEIEESAGDRIAADFLELFPYQEHPRNVALVGQMAETLGVDRELAIYTMAKNVVPDLGVLKTYPWVRVRGRELQFINGCSANERTGFLNNWKRTGCATLDVDDELDRFLITSVNNRDDRISRSEVFSRILTEDVRVDRHVLLGTNLQGLRGFMRDALDALLDATTILRPLDASPQAQGPAQAQAPAKAAPPVERLKALLSRVRIPAPTPETALRRLEIYARGAGRGLADTRPLLRVLAERFGAEDREWSLRAVLREVRGDRELQNAYEAALSEADAPPQPERPEVLGPCGLEDVHAHFTHLVARMTIARRMITAVETAVARGDGQASGFEGLNTAIRTAARELFEDLVDVIDDPQATGDQIVARCAAAVPPGARVTIMGTQNIKGTGLDFAYRWLAIGTVSEALERAQSANGDVRKEALQRLESFGDHGFVDTGLIVHHLGAATPEDPGERQVLERALAKARAVHASKIKDLAGDDSKGPDLAARFLTWVEGWIDFVDGAVRFHQSRGVMRELAAGRISHDRAAVRMRKVYDRTKAGWLAKWVKKRRVARG